MARHGEAVAAAVVRGGSHAGFARGFACGMRSGPRRFSDLRMRHIVPHASHRTRRSASLAPARLSVFFLFALASRAMSGIPQCGWLNSAPARAAYMDAMPPPMSYASSQGSSCPPPMAYASSQGSSCCTLCEMVSIGTTYEEVNPVELGLHSPSCSPIPWPCKLAEFVGPLQPLIPWPERLARHCWLPRRTDPGRISSARADKMYRFLLDVNERNGWQ